LQATLPKITAQAHTVQLRQPKADGVGNPYDNALAESFVATLRTECFGDSIPPTKAVAKLMVFDYSSA
jgi:hypothetical protein